MLSPRLLALLVSALAFVCGSDAFSQIYADVQVGGAVNGAFTITLEHQKAPAAVANFIGLATGKRGWIDLNTGAIRYDGFYNGVTFHRVIAGFMSQTGSRAGDGTDGPGYTFRNEIDPALKHDGAYVVAMANSGKNTNGSQFYITAAAAPWLDGGYTIFGHVTAGQAVCDQINSTPTNSTNDKPLTAITIQSINVYGPSLASFDPSPGLLPKLRNGAPVPKKSGATYSLDFDRRTFSDYLVYRTGDFTAWTKLASGYAGATAMASALDVTSSASGGRQFYRVARIDYASCALADLAGNTFQFSNPLGGSAALNAAKTGGTWTFSGGGSLTITSATFTPKPYSAQLFLQLSNNMQFLLNLQYDTTTGGAYSGQTNVTGFETVQGTFSVAP